MMKSDEAMSSASAMMIMETIGKQPYLLQSTTKPVLLDIKKPHIKIKECDTITEPSFPKQTTTETKVTTSFEDKPKKPAI